MSNKLTQFHPRLYLLDTLIMNLYEMVYGNSDDYQPIFLDASDLNMDRFKMPNYDLDTIFTPVVSYIKTSSSGLVHKKGIDIIYLKRTGSSKDVTIEIIEYENKHVANIITNPINVNKVIRTLLSELVINKKTNKILLPIINVDATGVILGKYEFLKSMVDSNKTYSISITEHYYKIITLSHFLKNTINNYVLMKIITDIVDTLYQINIIYPKFRCNNLLLEMINCHVYKNDEGRLLPIIKLSNFYLADIGDIIHNDYLTENNLPIMGDNLPYNDLYQFLNNLWNMHQIHIEQYPDIVQIFDMLLPKKIRSTTSMYLPLKIWDTLSDDQKNELNIRTIRGKLLDIVNKKVNDKIEKKVDLPINDKKVDMPVSDEIETDISVDDLENSDLYINNSRITSETENKISNNIDIDNMSKKKSRRDTEQLNTINDSDMVKAKYSQKVYRGTRNIGSSENNSYAPSRVSNHQNPNNINSIGQFLGNNPNDINNKQPDVNQHQMHPQVPQEMAPQYDQEMMQRYMLAMNNNQQMPPQMPQSMPQQYMPQQMDPNMLSMMQQQQQMPQYIPQQMGGYNRNPFFFR